jgi:hypothetical protein
MKKPLNFIRFKGLLFVTAILFWQSCDQPKQNDAVIPYDTMVQVMADVQMAESYEKLGRENGIRNPQLLDSLYELIYLQHDITAAQLDTSLKFYSKQKYFPEMLSEVISTVEEFEN